MNGFVMNTQKAIEWISDTDGYTVLSPEFFEGILAPHTIERLTMDHAGGTSKHAVMKDGEVLTQCIGVAEFAAVDALARQLGVEPCHEWMGRGKNFRTTVSRCLAVLRHTSE